MDKRTYSVNERDKGGRLDHFIASKSGFSRASVQKLIKQSLLLVNSRTEKASYRIRPGDFIEITIPVKPDVSVSPENIPVEVLWEDDFIIAVNKPAGMVVYPGAGHRSGTLINALAARCEKFATIGAPLRPGVVHRLDKDTSGAIVIAKDDSVFLKLQKMFKSREIEKKYLALLYGDLKKDSGEINKAIGRSISDGKKMSTRTRRGREAVTRFKILNKFKHAALAEITIITGRTHQIRVHFASQGHPVLGDRTYGKISVIKSGHKIIRFKRQMLHAHMLRFHHPVHGQLLELSAPIPEDMQKALGELSEQNN
jgi:23S rRNA pseudouridine1911/1915/1917 synthase